MSLSSIESIVSAVGMNDGGFDFTKTLGSFINNREFGEGFRRAVQSQTEDRDTYVWNALSAIGNRMGEITYSNVRNYIDLVSNVDTCKVVALNSMLKNFGVNYKGVKHLDKYPLEIVSLMDVFSINKKFLLDNEKIKEDLVNDISSNCVSENRSTIDDNLYKEYVSGVFGELLSSFLNLRYNTD